MHISKWSTSLSASQRDGRWKDEIEQKRLIDEISINLINLRPIDDQTQMLLLKISMKHIQLSINRIAQRKRGRQQIEKKN